MIRLKIINKKEDHFIITSTEPVRIEVIKTEKGKILTYAYRGVLTDSTQEPDVVYDNI